MPIALNLPPLLAHDIVIRQRGGPSVHLLRAGMPLDRPMRVTRSLATANAGDLRLECMRFGGGHAPRRLAGLNLGPIPEGTLISCRLEMANRDVGALSVRWDGGFLGPAPIWLGDWCPGPPGGVSPDRRRRRRCTGTPRTSRY